MNKKIILSSSTDLHCHSYFVFCMLYYILEGKQMSNKHGPSFLLGDFPYQRHDSWDVITNYEE